MDALAFSGACVAAYCAAFLIDSLIERFNHTK
jgi:hypothetical protein